MEGYGCSLNLGSTEKIQSLLKKKFELVNSPKKADFIIINTCAVKAPTERHMIKRIKKLGKIAESMGSKLIVCGCLPLISPQKIQNASSTAVLLGVELGEIGEFFSIRTPKNELQIKNFRENPVIAIIPIASGCLGECAYCCVKQARGNLKSHSIPKIKRAFKQALESAKEFWLTSNDNACYGFDQNTDLAELLNELLEVKGEYRVRLGMMNPAHLSEFFPRLLQAMDDSRVYKFLHLPVQSGSNKILNSMNRNYSIKGFKALVSMAREKFPDLTLSTDIIAGFPSETEKDFKKSTELIKGSQPDIVNLSRFGLRPNTKAQKMKGKIHGKITKERTRKLTKLVKKISLKKNKRFEGKIQKILVSEKGSKGGFIGRNKSYKPVIVKSASLGEFLNVKIKKAKQTYLVGEVTPAN